MHFLPDVLVRCPVCRGRRYKRQVLEVQYRGMDIAQVLELTIEEALPLFEDVPAVKSRLELMVETGLGYLQLGQPASSFSGGEAQRVKLAKELAARSTGTHPVPAGRADHGFAPGGRAGACCSCCRGWWRRATA